MSYSWGDDTAASWNSSPGFSYGSAKKAYDEEKAYVPKGPSKDMKSAYMLSQKVMDAALSKPEKDLLSKLTKDDVLVTPGQYDSVQNVLKAVGTPHTLASSRTIELDPKQIVLVNCPGNDVRLSYKGSSGVPALRKFVEDGGFLVTTDWALDSVVMEAFPGYVRHGGTDTMNDVVEVDLVAKGSPYTKGLGGGSLKPVWWLESKSYPIQLLRNKAVDVLLGSEEMKGKYGESPVAVKFPVGDGRVVHVTSHFYLQTSKSKYDAQEQKTGLDFATKFVGMAQDDASQIAGLESVSFGALESAYTSVRFLHNIFLERIKKENPAEAKKIEAEEVKLLGGQKAVSLRKLPGGGQTKKLGE